MNENPIFGRKVFLINPSLFIEHMIFEQLKELEYEVYIIANYKIVKSVLKQFPDSLCFIDIDTELSFSEWFNFIKSFKEDEVLKTVFVGILSETVKPADKEKFMLHLSLPGGFISIDKKSAGLFDNFKGILDLNGAKGRRQYLRLTVKNEPICGYFAAKDKLFAIDVDNISSVGLACILKKSMEQYFVENSIISNISITIARRSIVMNCLVLKKIPEENGNIKAVLLFTKDTPVSVKTHIRKFIFDIYDAKMEEIKKNALHDDSSYKVPDVFKDLSTVRSESDDYLNAPVENIESAEEAEDSSGSKNFAPDIDDF